MQVRICERGVRIPRNDLLENIIGTKHVNFVNAEPFVTTLGNEDYCTTCTTIFWNFDLADFAKYIFFNIFKENKIKKMFKKRTSDISFFKKKHMLADIIN